MNNIYKQLDYKLVIEHLKYKNNNHSKCNEQQKPLTGLSSKILKTNY